MKKAPYERLLDTGIVQFGYFIVDGKAAPVRFCPEYLPAYPLLLAEVAKLALMLFDVSKVSHLIATSESVPLGLAGSLQTSLSLVYSRGRGEEAVYDLVGSYNSGHISVLMMNHLEEIGDTQTFISKARRVGLEVQQIVALLEMRPFDQLAGIPIRSVFRLVDLVQDLVTIGRLSEGQAQAVRVWIQQP